MNLECILLENKEREEYLKRLKDVGEISFFLYKNFNMSLEVSNLNNDGFSVNYNGNTYEVIVKGV